MFTREQINKILEPWKSSLDERPLPTKDSYAYATKDRNTAWDMAMEWQNEHDCPAVEALRDFICHQSDVIEILAHALSFANQRLKPLRASGSIYTDRWCSACLGWIHESDKFCRHCGQAISWAGILKENVNEKEL